MSSAYDEEVFEVAQRIEEEAEDRETPIQHEDAIRLARRRLESKR